MINLHFMGGGKKTVSFVSTLRLLVRPFLFPDLLKTIDNSRLRYRGLHNVPKRPVLHTHTRTYMYVHVYIIISPFIISSFLLVSRLMTEKGSSC